MTGKRFVVPMAAVLALVAGITGTRALGADLTVYTAIEDDEIAVYRKDFEAKHPDIHLKIVRDSTGIITARLLAEKDNPQADVIWGVALTSLLICDKNGMLAGYNPKGIERIRKGFRDEKNAKARWVGIKAWETGIVGNTVELRKLGVALPGSYADLIKPEYKGRIVMPNPASSGTGYLTVSAILQLMGEQKGWEYLDRLHANIAQYTHSGSKPAKMAGKGEFPVGISFGYRGFKQKAAGEPVEVAFPKEGSGWDLESNALVRKPKIDPAARTFLDWAISDDAMKMYAKIFSPNITVEMDVEAPAGYPKDFRKLLIKNNFEWAAQNRDRILAEWSRRYDGKSEAKN